MGSHFKEDITFNFNRFKLYMLLQLYFLYGYKDYKMPNIDIQYIGNIFRGKIDFF